MPFAQPDVIARNADKPFHQNRKCRLSVHLVRNRLDEDHNIAAFRLTVMDEGHPVRRRRQCDPIHHQVVAHQERILHRTGGNDKVLPEKSQDKQPDH